MKKRIIGCAEIPLWSSQMPLQRTIAVWVDNSCLQSPDFVEQNRCGVSASVLFSSEDNENAKVTHFKSCSESHSPFCRRSLSTHPFSSSALGKSIVLCRGSYWPTRRGHGRELLTAAEGHGRNRTPREPYRCHRVSYRCREKQESDLQPKKRRPSQYVPFVPSLKKIHISSYRRLYLKNRNIFPV